MYQRLKQEPWLMMCLGLSLGLAIGAGMMVGALTLNGRGNGESWEFPETLLHATATHGGETMAIATGPIDDGVEGLFVLDYVTGQLQCSVINPRTGQLGGLFRYYVFRDLGVEQGKIPKLLMVTGLADFRSSGNVRPAQSLVYVADSTTGNYAAYMLPWNRTAASYAFGQVQAMILIGKGSARNIPIE